jgi:hypothetical protein
MGFVGSMIHTNERIEAELKKRFTALISGFLLQTAPTGLRLLDRQTAAPFQQRHLGGQMAALTDLHHPLRWQETDIVTAPVAAGAYEP